MDPISIFSLFCNVLTVVDAAIKTTKTMKDLYDSSTGYSKTNQGIQDEAGHLEEIAKELSLSQSQLASYRPHHPLLGKVTEECTRISEKVQLVLGECKVSSKGPRAVAVLKSWAKTQARKSEINDLFKDLQACSDRLNTAMALATRADMLALKETLRKIDTGQSDLITRLSLLGQQMASHNAILPDITRLVSLAEEAQSSINHALVLRALGSPNAQTRESEVAVHHGKTFEWIVNSNTSTVNSEAYSDRFSVPDFGFLYWLKDGSGVFHIAGKPGSGKSTIMKFLANDSRVLEALGLWAKRPGKQLIVSKFFFWRHGSKDQRSVSGLLRGLLFGICQSSPRITKLLFPSWWGKGGSAGVDALITDDQIRAAFDQLKNNEGIHRNFTFCFFIDGLDEFDGAEMAHWRLASMLRDWSHQHDDVANKSTELHLKLCVSSREEHAIMAAFDNCPRVRLQDITKRDISALVQDTLNRNVYFQRLKEKDAGGHWHYLSLVDSILDGADGVFLWVAIVLNLVEDELPGASSIDRLETIIRTTPSQIEDLIDNMLKTIKNHHRQQAYFALAIVLRMLGHHLSDTGTFPPEEQHDYDAIFESHKSWRPYIPAYGLSVALENLSTKARPLSTSYYQGMRDSTQTANYQVCKANAVNSIRSWCKGLLDAFDITDSGTSWDKQVEFPDASLDDESLTAVRFMHRSIPDYLLSIIREKASDHGFDDDDVAEAILVALIAETSASCGGIETAPPARILSQYLQHVLRLLRLRTISDSSGIFQLLQTLETVRFDAFRHVCGQSHHVQSFPGCSDSLLAGTQQKAILVIERHGLDNDVLEDAMPQYYTHRTQWARDVNSTVLGLASHSGLYEYVRWKLTRMKSPDQGQTAPRDIQEAFLLSALISLNAFNSDFLFSWFTRAHNETLEILLHAGARIDPPRSLANNITSCFPPEAWEKAIFEVGMHPRKITTAVAQTSTPFRGWIWLERIPFILGTLCKNPCSPEFWSFLQAWLIAGGAPPPERISVKYARYWPGKGDPYRKTTITYIKYQVAVGRLEGQSCPRTTTSTTINGVDGEAAAEIAYGSWDAYVNGHWLIAAGVIPRDIEYTPEIDVSPDISKGASRNRYAGRTKLTDSTWSKEFSLADLVRYYEPHNMDVLLRHLEKYENGQ